MAALLRSRPQRALPLAIWATLLSHALLTFLQSQTTSIGSHVLLPHKLFLPAQFDTSVDAIAEHPIKDLVRKAEAEFAEVLAKQSNSYETAASEYLRRYNRKPPPGFEIWYDYATKHDSLIVDDFDIIDETLAPFWTLSGAEVKRRLTEVRGPSISYCQPSDRERKAGCGSLGGEVLEMLQESELFTHFPDIDLLINEMDEPRVLRGSDDGNEQLLDWEDVSHQHVWGEITAGCYNKGAPRVMRLTSAVHEPEISCLKLCTSSSDAIDLCRHPEYSNMHGLWRSPMSFIAIRAKVPILSPAVPSTMGDIPFPAAAHLNPTFSYNASEDISCENKTAGLYWAGSTTGSFQEAADQAWKQDHRQRFVSLANDLEPKVHTYISRSRGSVPWQNRTSSALSQSLYAIHFTDVVQFADQATNNSIREYFHFHEEEPREKGFRYTLTFDLDGNSHSGRFHRLLNSRSLPLKQTMFREWHDKRLQPWLHYVPISLGLEDLPEVVRYLADEEEGRQVAAVPAERGREWSLRVLRPVDQAVYLFRLMLELARLQDPGRPAS
ncbi:hypothetical protein Q7P35_009731 [Cladosporium inversicolor]